MSEWETGNWKDTYQEVKEVTWQSCQLVAWFISFSFNFRL